MNNADIRTEFLSNNEGRDISVIAVRNGFLAECAVASTALAAVF
jgi:hypothetical protein